MEIGFWDYTCPGHGSIEQYTKADWDILLDDMVEGGFNSFVYCVKWISTGYRSALPWIDQDPSVTGISTDNAIHHYALEGMKKRGMHVRLLVVGTQYHLAKFGLNLTNEEDRWGEFGNFDLDHPGLLERIEALYGEIASLFGSYAEGMVVELEFCDRDAPHRVPLYDAWAKENGRPDYATLKNIRLEPRSYPFWDWRDYTTDRRIAVWSRIEQVVRANGFTGEMIALTELGNAPMVLVGNANLDRIHKALPHWALVTYDSNYDRRLNRLATMDFCIEQPRGFGFDPYWLTRGVMTFGANWDDITDSLAEQWRMELEDARDHKPRALWFMGSDARLDGMVASNVKLPKWGYPDGRTARKALMAMAREVLPG